MTAMDQQANLTVTVPPYSPQQSAPWAGDQVNPSVAMDADGDLTVAWDGNGADSSNLLNPTDLSQVYDNDPQGVWVRSFHAKDPQQTEEEAVTMESRVNLTQPGTQQFSSVAMMPNGSYVVVWSGNGAGDFQGVFFRRYVESSDTAGPMVVDGVNANGDHVQSELVTSLSGANTIQLTFDKPITNPSDANTIVLTFDEAMLVYTPQQISQAKAWVAANPTKPIPDDTLRILDSVTNPDNYLLMKDGVPIAGAVQQVTYQLDPVTNKYEATVTLNGATVRKVTGASVTVSPTATKLAANVTADGTVLQVDPASAGAFPLNGPFTVVVDGEHMLVTAGFGTTMWTVTRHTDGTSAAVHTSGAAVTLVTALNGTINGTATQIHVDAATAATFPATGPFTIVIDNEHMLVTAGFGTTTWTVQRQTDGTTVAAHASGATISLLDTSLPNGNYTLQMLAPTQGATNTSGLCDRVGNPLEKTGFTPDGNNISLSFVINAASSVLNLSLPSSPTADQSQLSAANQQAILVNELTSGEQVTTAGRSVAVDGDGDFVAVWTRTDTIIDPMGNPVADQNIYARYFTDDVQRLTLPASIATDTDGNANDFGQFNFVYGADKIEQITISDSNKPYDAPTMIQGRFNLEYDINNDGVYTANEVVGVNFDESDMAGNAQRMQAALQEIQGLGNVVVQAVSPLVYLVDFGASTLPAGNQQSDLQIQWQATSEGWLPGAVVEAVNEPFMTPSIAVSPTNPWLTAASIETAFRNYADWATQNATTYNDLKPSNPFEPAATGPALMGPVQFPPPERLDTAGIPYTAPLATNNVLPVVSVVPVTNADGTLSTTQFDITFIGASANQVEPLLVAANLVDDKGVALPDTEKAIVATIKEPGHEFRVNPQELDDPSTPDCLDVYDQTNPSVAMDASGDFVIVWQSVVPNSQDYGSVSDIFERRYSPVGNRISPDGTVDDSVVVPDMVDADSVQILTFTPGNNNLFSFTLKADNPGTGKQNAETGSITFDDTSLASLAEVAHSISTQLSALGYSPKVTLLGGTPAGQYQFEVQLGVSGAHFQLHADYGGRHDAGGRVLFPVRIGRGADLHITRVPEDRDPPIRFRGRGPHVAVPVDGRIGYHDAHHL